MEETNAFNTSITDSNIQELYIKSSETIHKGSSLTYIFIQVTPITSLTIV